MRLHCGHFLDQTFVGIPFQTIGVNLALESVRIQDGRLVQEPFVTANVKFNFSLPIAPAGNRFWLMYTAPHRGDVETVSIVRSASATSARGISAARRRTALMDDLVCFELLARLCRAVPQFANQVNDVAAP